MSSNNSNSNINNNNNKRKRKKQAKMSTSQPVASTSAAGTVSKKETEMMVSQQQQQNMIASKVKTAKAGQTASSSKNSVVAENDIVNNQTKRPRLVPPASLYYNIIKRVLADVYVKQNTYSLYHVWLDCLYDEDVTVEMILDKFQPILGTLNRADISPKFIYIVASQPEDDVPPVPAGACFVMISNSLIKQRAKSLDKFELKVMYNKLHMFRVSIPMLRDQLKDSCSLIFTEAYLDLLNNVPVRLLRQVMDLPIDYKPEPNSQQAKQPKSEPQKQPKLEPQKQPKLEPQKQPKLEPQKQPKLEPQKQPKLEPQKQPKLEPQKQPKLKPQQQPTTVPDQLSQPNLKQPPQQKSKPQQIQPQQKPKQLPAKDAQLDQLNLNPSSIIDVEELETNSLHAPNTPKVDNLSPFHPSISRPSNLYNGASLLIDLTTDDKECDESSNDTENKYSDANSNRATSPQTSNANESQFIPVTSKSLGQAVSLMKKFEEERRPVAVVFDPYFFLNNPDLNVIRTKFERIFGEIRDNQVLIRSNLPRLMESVEQANETGIKTLNQAFIIGDKGLSNSEINRRAARENIFCCPMTIGVVINSLKRGIFLMHNNFLLNNKNVINGRSTPKRNLAPELGAENKVSNIKAIRTVNQDYSQPAKKSPPLVKRNRIAASLNGSSDTLLDSQKESQPTSSSSEQKTSPLSKSQLNNSSLVDDQLWKSLKGRGDVVLRVDNLPGKLTVQALNIMMGTFSLNSDQMVASKKKHLGNELMDLRVVLHSNHADLNRMMAKNGCQTYYNSVLLIGRTNFDELHDFLAKNHDNVHWLSKDDKLPINAVGYKREQDFQNTSFKVSVKQ